jgi:hypothetical protein
VLTEDLEQVEGVDRLAREGAHEDQGVRVEVSGFEAPDDLDVSQRRYRVGRPTSASAAMSRIVMRE